MKIIDMLVKMANDDNFRPIAIKFYNDLFVWNSKYKDWLKYIWKFVLAMIVILLIIMLIIA